RSQPTEREVRLSRVRVDDSGRLWSGRLADAQPAAGTRRKRLSSFRSLREPQPQTVRTIACKARSRPRVSSEGTAPARGKETQLSAALRSQSDRDCRGLLTVTVACSPPLLASWQLPIVPGKLAVRGLPGAERRDAEAAGRNALTGSFAAT